jgi:hypothetical protein
MSVIPKTICVMVADVVGSFRLREKLGSKEAQHAIERCIHRLQRAAEAAKGQIVKTSGDESTITFASAEEAMHAASEMQERIATLPPVSGIALGIRIGFHVGPVEEQRGELFGDTVAIASRLSKLATAGQVLTTVDTAEALPETLRQQTRTVEGQVVESLHGNSRIANVIWNPAEEVRDGPGVAIAGTGARLRLRHGEQVLVLGPDRPVAHFGRDLESEITITHSRASRVHGRIERRDGNYVLIDQSTNGTFLTFANEPEISLRRVEVLLRGKGRFSCGQSTSVPDSELIEFEVLDH